MDQDSAPTEATQAEVAAAIDAVEQPHTTTDGNSDACSAVAIARRWLRTVRTTLAVYRRLWCVGYPPADG